MVSPTENITSQYMNYVPENLESNDLPRGFIDFLLPFHKQFTPLATEAGGETRRGSAGFASGQGAELLARV